MLELTVRISCMLLSRSFSRFFFWFRDNHKQRNRNKHCGKLEAKFRFHSPPTMRSSLARSPFAISLLVDLSFSLSFLVPNFLQFFFSLLCFSVSRLPPFVHRFRFIVRFSRYFSNSTIINSHLCYCWK